MTDAVCIEVLTAHETVLFDTFGVSDCPAAGSSHLGPSQLRSPSFKEVTQED